MLKHLNKQTKGGDMIFCHTSGGRSRGHFGFHGMPNIFVHCCFSEEDELKHLEQYRDHLQEELKSVEERIQKLGKKKDNQAQEV